MSSSEPPVILVAVTDAAVRRLVLTEIEDALPDVAAVTADPPAVVATARRLAADGRTVPLVVVDDAVLTSTGADGDLVELHGAVGAASRILLVTGRDELTGADAALSGGHLHGVVADSLTPGEFGRHLTAQVRRGLSGSLPMRPPAGRARALEALEADEDVTTDALLAALDRSLGRRPRLRLATGTVLVREGEPVNGVFVVVSGRLRLARRTSYGDQGLHQATAGPVIGLLSFTQQRVAYVTAVATSELTVVHLTLEQLDQAMRTDPEVATLFSALLLRALAARLVRADELQLEVRLLNRTIAEERDRLAAAMARLEAAEVQLVDAARMATLGELSAGIAHELNNPAGALQRAADHLAEDVARLLDDDDRRVLEEAIAATPSSTAALRRARRELAGALGEAGLAEQLVRAGITDPEEARRTAAAGPEAVDRHVRLHQLGVAIRNTTSAGQRIAGLVASLRAYVRGEEGGERDLVDVREGLDDTLGLLGHRLTGVDVERRYGEVPSVHGVAGELNQVWTNLLVNAADALEGGGHVVVAVDAPDARRVRVRIIDDGPGVPPELAQRIFEPRFTTKGGRVEFGLGLGLSIARRIVDAHGGTIDLRSADGTTTATVELPATGTRTSAEEDGT